MAHKLIVRNIMQAAIFECELKGQLSDGWWENSRPDGHWIPWSTAECLVGDNLGRNFEARKSNYDFAKKDLLDVVGSRMLGYARLAKVFGLPTAILIHDLSIMNCHEEPSINWYATWLQEKHKEIIVGLDMDGIDKALADESYGLKELRADLRDLSKIIRNVSMGGEMTKSEEVKLLDITIDKFGPDSYLGPWLKEIREELVRDITSDLPPSSMMPSTAIKEAVLILATAKTDALKIRDDANEYARVLREKVHADMDHVRRDARLAMERLVSRI